MFDFLYLIYHNVYIVSNIIFDFAYIIYYYQDIPYKEVNILMGFSYKPLWHLLLELGKTKTQMREELGLSPSTLAKLGKDEYVSMEVLDKICLKYQVPLSKVVEHKKEG